MSTVYIGIDNGTSGAIAAIDESGVLDVVSMPIVVVGDSTFIDATVVKSWLLAFRSVSTTPLRVTFEQGSKQPKFGTKGNFANGYSFGVIKTILELGANDGLLVFQCVNPRTWQKLIFQDLRGVGNGNTKGASIEICRRRWPSVNLVPVRCRTVHDGWADALCMADYSARTMR